jgi:hypothetical protein
MDRANSVDIPENQLSTGQKCRAMAGMWILWAILFLPCVVIRHLLQHDVAASRMEEKSSQWLEQEATVTSTQVSMIQSRQGRTRYYGHIEYVYNIRGLKLHGERYSFFGDEQFLSSFLADRDMPKKGDVIKIYCDPADPRESVVNRESAGIRGIADAQFYYYVLYAVAAVLLVVAGLMIMFPARAIAFNSWKKQIDLNAYKPLF